MQPACARRSAPSEQHVIPSGTLPLLNPTRPPPPAPGQAQHAAAPTSGRTAADCSACGTRRTLTLTPTYFSATPPASVCSSPASPSASRPAAGAGAAGPDSRFCMTSSPLPPAASAAKISRKFLATPCRAQLAVYKPERPLNRSCAARLSAAPAPVASPQRYQAGRHAEPAGDREHATSLTRRGRPCESRRHVGWRRGRRALNVRSMASSLRMSSVLMSSRILASPRAFSPWRRRRRSRSSVKLVHWSSALRLTCLRPRSHIAGARGRQLFWGGGRKSLGRRVYPAARLLVDACGS